MHCLWHATHGFVAIRIHVNSERNREKKERDCYH